MPKYTFEQLKEAMSSNHSTRQNFLQNILTVATSMLAILAAFHTTEDAVVYARSAFSGTVILLSISIISGGVVLYFDVRAAKYIFLKVKDEVSKGLLDNDYQGSNIVYNPPVMFFICEKVCYISLLLSIVTLTIYVLIR